MSDELTELNQSVDASVTDNSGDDDYSNVDIKSLMEENKRLKDGNSMLGRKFKAFEESQEAFRDQILNEIRESRMAGGKEKDDNYDDFGSYDDDNEEEKIAKVAAMVYKKQSEKEKSERMKLEQKYISDYDRTIQALGRDEDPGLYEQVLEQLKGMPGYTTDGKQDAEKNFHKAMINVLRNSKASESNSVFRQDNPKGTKIGGASKVTGGKDVDAGELEKMESDPAFKSYMAYRGRHKNDNEEFVKRVLSSSEKPSGKMRI